MDERASELLEKPDDTLFTNGGCHVFALVLQSSPSFRYCGSMKTEALGIIWRVIREADFSWISLDGSLIRNT